MDSATENTLTLLANLVGKVNANVQLNEDERNRIYYLTMNLIDAFELLEKNIASMSYDMHRWMHSLDDIFAIRDRYGRS